MLKFGLFFILSIAISVVRAEDSGGDNYAVIINGGGNLQSNSPRYFENVHAMYDAFRTTGVPSDHIMVLYGSGKVEDTASQSSQPQFPAMGGGMAPPGAYGPYGYGAPAGYVYPAQAPSAAPVAMGSIAPGQAAPVNPPAPTVTLPSTVTLDYLFNGEKRGLDGGANTENIEEKFRQLRSKLKPGDNVTLYITDHGQQNPEGGTSVTLWNESISVDKLGDLMRQFPDSNKVRVVTNICYGGGLTELTSTNVCVFANQAGNKPSNSDSIDLDMYGQNFPYALKKKIDFDKDGKPTFWDAHQYAASLDNPANTPTTSLDWFLQKNKNKIVELRDKNKSKPNAACIIHPDDALKQIANLIEDFEIMKSKISLSTDSVPSSRQSFLKGRIEKTIQSLKNRDSATIISELDMKIQDLRTSLLESAKKWGQLTPEEQAAKRQLTQLDAQQIRVKLAQLERDRKKFESLNLELDLLKYGDDSMVKEYSSIRSCLEHAY